MNTTSIIIYNNIYHLNYYGTGTVQYGDPTLKKKHTQFLV